MRCGPGHLLLVLLIAGCGGSVKVKEPAKGGRYYGGIFNVNETERLRAIFPLSLSQASAHRVASQIYQGLVRLDQHDLTIKPCLAESWERNPDATEYTFHLRSGVFFHDDPIFPDGKGREFVAADVLSCFNAICTASDRNQMFWLFQDRVVGADEHYAASKKKGGTELEGVKGVEVLDEHTVRIRLANPTPNFLQIMAHQGCWIWPHELLEQHADDLLTHAVGTGPFTLKAFRAGEVIILERDPNYWDRDSFGNALPFLDGMRVTFLPEKAQELVEFRRGHLSAMYEVPVDSLSVLADSVDHSTGAVRFVVQGVPGLTTQFYGFNASRPPFNDVRVRRAFAMAIDRKLLVDSVLRGLAVPAEHGLVAPGLVGYPYGQAGGFAFDPDSARKLMTDAGYPGGRGFPPMLLQINVDGFGYAQVAGAVQNMLWSELGVSVAVSALPSEQHYDRVERSAVQFWREGWIADYPDPDNFLSLLYGKNAVLDTSKRTFLNSTRYHSARFDSLFTAAQRTMSDPMRMHGLAQAEHQAMDDAALAPLYHERNIRLLQPWVRDFPINAMEYRDLSGVWMDPTAHRSR